MAILQRRESRKLSQHLNINKATSYRLNGNHVKERIKGIIMMTISQLLFLNSSFG